MTRSAILRAHLAEARAAWPTLAWTDDELAAWLVEQGGEELEAKLASADPRDTVLCFAASRGDPEAHRLFDRHVIPHVAQALRRMTPDAATIDEVAQRVRVKLFVPKPGERYAPIAKFALGGRLVGLVRVAAVREAVSLRRGDKPAAGPAVLERLVGVQDPELRILKHKYAAEFEQAFAEAVTALAPRDRQLLRLHLSANASIDDIARMFKTHRSTAARWLTSAREALARETRQRLISQLGLSERELDELLALIRTQAARLLASIPPDP